MSKTLPSDSTVFVKQIIALFVGVALIGGLAYLASAGVDVMSILMMGTGGILLGAVIWKGLKRKR